MIGEDREVGILPHGLFRGLYFQCPHTCALLFQVFWEIWCSNCAFSHKACLKHARSSERAEVCGILQLCCVYETYGLTYRRELAAVTGAYLLGREVYKSWRFDAKNDIVP